jgi:hypothetical protein
MMYLNFIDQTIANFAQSWYVTLFASLITGGLGLVGVLLTIRYYKKRDEQKIYLELASKGGVLVDLYLVLAMHYLYAEKLRLGLEIDKYYLDVLGKDKFTVDEFILKSGNFALYKDAKNRTESVKLNLVKSTEVFWTIVNQNIAQSPEKEISYNKALSIGKSIKELNTYTLKSSEFEKILKKDMASRMKTDQTDVFQNWAFQEEMKMNEMIEEDKTKLNEMVLDLDKNIKELSLHLQKYFLSTKLSSWFWRSN